MHSRGALPACTRLIVTPGNDEPPAAGGSRDSRAATRFSDRGRLETTATEDATSTEKETRDINRQARYLEEDEGLAAVITVARKSRGDAPAG